MSCQIFLPGILTSGIQYADLTITKQAGTPAATDTPGTGEAFEAQMRPLGNGTLTWRLLQRSRGIQTMTTW